MIKVKAYWLRWCHLMRSIMVLDRKHLSYTEGISTTVAGIEIWFKANKISCTCGKCWYDYSSDPDPVNQKRGFKYWFVGILILVWFSYLIHRYITVWM